MNTLDIIFIIVISIGFIWGCYKGIVKQITLGAGTVIGLLQAILFYNIAGYKINQYTDWNILICNVLGFVIIFTFFIIIFQLIGSIIRYFLKLILLGYADRVLGGLLTGIITVLLFVGVVSYISKIDETNTLLGKTSQENSTLYKPMRKLSIKILEEVKKEIHEKKE